jgi:hypothetical protein
VSSLYKKRISSSSTLADNASWWLILDPSYELADLRVGGEAF